MLAGASNGDWRAGVLDGVTMWTARLGSVLAIALVASAAARTPARLVEPGFAFMIASFLGVVALRHQKVLPYRWHAFAFCGLVFGTGAAALHSLGVQPGPTLVVAFVVLAARLFSGARAMLVSLMLGTAAVVSAGLAHPASVSWLDEAPLGAWFWVRFGLGFAMPTGVIAMLVAHVVERLERSLLATAEALSRSVVAESERERSQEALAKAEKALLRSQKLEAVGRLAAGVGHDFNNTLQVMLSWASILKDEENPATIAEGLDAIERAALQGRELTHRLLAFGRRDVRTPVRASPTQLVGDSAGSLRRLLPEDIAIELAVDESAPDVLVDPDQLAHVLLNLGVNARDAMPAGGALRLSVASLVPGEAPEGAPPLAKDGLVHITVQDTGVGMGPEALGHLFEPFYTTKGERGTGLGLATSYSLVRRNGGTIRVESAPGEGTTIHLYFPAQRGEAVPVSQPDAVQPHTGGGVVMIAEDDSDVRRTMVHALQAAGYEVLETADAPGAMQLIDVRGRDVDVLCTDGIMPGGGTRQLIDHYLACRPGGQVIVCSGYVQEELLRRDLDAGAHSYLPKPFHTNELLARIRRLLEQARVAGS
jgi:signal transduction histidine kinase/CheY-like chemotaxis protein